MSTFETFSDVSRKLDTILQLLKGPQGLAALQEAIRQPAQTPVSTMNPFKVEESIGAQTPYVESMGWNPPVQAFVPTYAPVAPVATPAATAGASDHLLEEILKKVSSPRVASTRPNPDLTSELFTINEELSRIRQQLSVRPEPYQAPIQSTGEVMDQLQVNNDTIGQLVDQSNENTGMIQELRQVLAEVKTLLLQNLSHRSADIQQLIDENQSLRDYLQRLARTNGRR